MKYINGLLTLERHEEFLYGNALRKNYRKQFSSPVWVGSRSRYRNAVAHYGIEHVHQECRNKGARWIVFYAHDFEGKMDIGKDGDVNGAIDLYPEGKS